eukprot:TRINITY_DN2406_c0_g1_i1.p1 TRINITY_DN2406_c0_g1~~TRINITY_DN2406_c0_g1_i1.p1  ORF type:complete len:223 (+),score=39.94 TRINITY_DN2406_c0_g1_i1:336-1004(+)
MQQYRNTEWSWEKNTVPSRSSFNVPEFSQAPVQRRGPFPMLRRTHRAPLRLRKNRGGFFGRVTKFLRKLNPWRPSSGESGIFDADKKPGQLPGVGLPRSFSGEAQRTRAHETAIYAARPGPVAKPIGFEIAMNGETRQLSRVPLSQVVPARSRFARAPRVAAVRARQVGALPAQQPVRTAQMGIGAQVASQAAIPAGISSGGYAGSRTRESGAGATGRREYY